jgi:hypothetical protein
MDKSKKNKEIVSVSPNILVKTKEHTEEWYEVGLTHCWDFVLLLVFKTKKRYVSGTGHLYWVKERREGLTVTLNRRDRAKGSD